MGRPKGSKNRSTLLKEAMQQQAGKTAAEVTIVAPVVVQPVVLPVEERRAENLPVWRLAMYRMELLRSYYGGKEVDDRFLNALEKVHTAPTLSQAEKVADAAVDNYSVSLMAAMARGHVPGPPTASRYKKVVASRQGLIKMLREKGGSEAKIAEYEAEIAAAEGAMGEGPVTPPWQTTKWLFVP